jgi:hypothetical protein
MGAGVVVTARQLVRVVDPEQADHLTCQLIGTLCTVQKGEQVADAASGFGGQHEPRVGVLRL